MSGTALALVLTGFLIGSMSIWKSAAASLPDAGLGGFAEMYVSTLLTQAGAGAEDVLAPYLGYSPDLTGLEPGTWYVSQTAVWSIEATGPEAWTVLVAATQLGLPECGYVPAGTFFYEVNIDDTPSGLKAAALPTLVATPSPTAPNVPRTSDIDERLTDAVAGFLTTRFTATDTTPFNIAPFDNVIVRSISTRGVDGDHLEVGVEFLGVDTAGRATPLAYQLRDVNRESS